MFKTIQYLIIDDEPSNTKLIRDGIKVHFKITEEGKSYMIFESCVVREYSVDNGVLHIIEIFEPTIEVIENVLAKYKKYLCGIIVDMIWTFEEKTGFYEDQDGLFNMEFKAMVDKIRHYYGEDFSKLPGGLRFIYKWYSSWAKLFEVSPVLIGKSAYFTDDLKNSLRTLGVELFINDDDMAERANIAFVIDNALQKYNWLFEVRKHQITAGFSIKRTTNSIIAPQNLVDFLLKVAKTKHTVMLLGESGTGKGFFAEFIHTNSDRHDKPFVFIDCGALPENLVESELFGYEKGAFTDAKTAKKGIFELADGGTVFLDEICNMPLQQQAKLLTVIENGVFRKLGSEELSHVDVRVIVATNDDIDQAKAEGRFREDLYWRLKHVKTTLPPLRERKKDIPALTNYFLNQFKKTPQPPRFAKEAEAALIYYDWPGNIRELRNVISLACEWIGKGDLITLLELGEDLLLAVQETAAGTVLSEWEQLEKDKLILLLKEENGNITQVANRYGNSRPTIYDKLNKYNIDISSYKSS